MYLIFLDTETTGCNPEKHRIIEIAFKVVDTVSSNPVVSYESIVQQPLEIWAEADPESLQITGFTWEEVLSGKPESVVASEIANDLNRLSLAEKEGVFVCQNPSFDRCYFLQLINADLQTHYGWPYHWLDLASMYWAIRLVEDKSNAKKLKENDLSKNRIAERYQIPREEIPHRAMKGVNHLIQCYQALFEHQKN